MTELTNVFARAKFVAVLTGAGMSAESGVPTFRDAQSGLWAKFCPEELATPSAFRKNPKLVWEWYAWRRKLVAAAKPNPGHLALAEMETLFPIFQVITQNVDGLHQLAGSQNVIELHGNLAVTRCFNEGTLISDWKQTEEIPPKCPKCGGPLRPGVVWFNEPLPESELRKAQFSAENCDLLLSIGTSTLVYPAAGLPLVALEHGATVIEINKEKTPITNRAHFVLTGPAAEILPELLRAAKASR